MYGSVRNEIRWFADNPISYDAEDVLSIVQLEEIEQRILEVEAELLPLNDAEAWVLLNFIKSSLSGVWAVFLEAVMSAPGWPFGGDLLLLDDVRNSPLTEFKDAAIAQGTRIIGNPHFPSDVIVAHSNIDTFLSKVSGGLSLNELSFVIYLATSYFGQLSPNTKIHVQKLVAENTTAQFDKMLEESLVFDRDRVAYFRTAAQ